MTISFKQRLQHGQVQTGMWLTVSSSETVAVVQEAGFDWCLIDEGCLADKTVRFDDLSSRGFQPIVRIIQDSSPGDFMPEPLNLPVMLPVKNARYPIGHNGKFLKDRPDLYAHSGLLGLVATSAVLAEVDAIVATKFLDAVIIDTAALAADMGLAGAPSCDKVQSAIETAARKLKGQAMPFGVVVFDGALVRTHLDQGATFLAVGGDAILAAKKLMLIGHMAEPVQD